MLDLSLTMAFRRRSHSDSIAGRNSVRQANVGADDAEGKFSDPLSVGQILKAIEPIRAE